jgi:phage gpG-like protein
VRFEFRTAGDTLISLEILRWGDRAVDARPAFEDIADMFRRTEKRRFDTRGDGTWQPLAASTTRQKLQSRNPTIRANAGRILVATGLLERSLTDKGAPEHLSIVQPQSLVFGSLVEYGGYHQKGEGVPVRKPLGFTEAARKDSVKILQRFIIGERRP